MPGLPMVVWGAVQDLSTWTNTALTVTPSQTDPYGGTGAATLNDASAATVGYVHKDFSFPANGSYLFPVWLEGGTATNSLIAVRDTTAAGYPVVFNVAWAAGVPTITVQSGAGAVAVAATLMASARYFALLRGDGVLAANTVGLRIFPAAATPTDVTLTGTIKAYVRPAAIPTSIFDNALYYPAPRAGSKFVQSGSGVEDAWITGTDFSLKGDWGWTPIRDTANPPATGWDGGYGLNGISAMLTWLRQKNQAFWTPDRTAPGTYNTVYLAEPMQDGPTLEPDGTKRLALTWRGSAAFTGY